MPKSQLDRKLLDSGQLQVLDLQTLGLTVILVINKAATQAQVSSFDVVRRRCKGSGPSAAMTQSSLDMPLLRCKQSLPVTSKIR